MKRDSPAVERRQVIRLRDRASRFMRRAQLGTAVLAAVAGAAVVAFSAYLVLHQLLPSGDDRIQPKDLTQFAFAIVVGIGGIVALVVTYRRQQGIEQSRFVERFGAAASQLGHTDVAVRLAGVYAMAGAADEASAQERQQCTDVLCGYLRLPYFPALGANHQSELQLKVPGREGEEHTRRFQYRQNDKEVRRTIVRVIAAHLQKEATNSWSECSFDFLGAVLEDADFSGAIFSGGRTIFSNATFGGDTRFSGATFSGTSTTFVGTTFSGRFTHFDRATFSGQGTSFYGATFSGEKTWFDEGIFSGKTISFDTARFTGDVTSFNEVTFSKGVTADFAAVFSGSVWFEEATFSGDTWFRRAVFGEGPVSFKSPRQWEPAPKFDWDDDLSAVKRKPKPDNVLPDDWPPKASNRI